MVSCIAWLHRLKLRDLLVSSPESGPDRDTHAATVGPIAADRLRADSSKFFPESQVALMEIADHFEIAETVDDFDTALKHLYDLADQDRVQIQ